MRLSASLCLVFVLLFAIQWTDAITMEYIDKVIAQGPYSANWKDILGRYRPPSWYIDAKFGIYTHWLISSVPAFGDEWYPRNMYVPGSVENLHQIKTYGPLSPTNGFKEFIPSFDAKNFDASEWMTLFQRAGAKYAGPVGEHHDGFPMYNCSLTPYTGVNMGPKRDVAALLLEASNNLPEKMHFIISSHRAWHFAFYDNGRKWANSDVNQCQCPSWEEDGQSIGPDLDPFYCNLYCPANTNETTPTQSFMEDWLLRTCEMADLYTPDVLWFDWWIGVSPLWRPWLEKMAAFYYNRLEGIGKIGVINTKGQTMPAGTDVLDFERGQACSVQRNYWQTDTSISVTSWGYISNDTYKSPRDIILSFVDIVSKNGGMLLNIGPPPNGTIPVAARNTLEKIGDWLKVTGDSVYGSRPYHIFGEGPTQVSCGTFTDNSRNSFTKKDFRFTVNPSKSVLYVTCMGAVAGDLVMVNSLGSGRLGQGTVTNVQVLGYSGSLDWKVNSGGLQVLLPNSLLTGDFPPVVSVYGMKDIQWDGIVRQGQDDLGVLLHSSLNDLLLGSLSLDVAGIYITVSGWTMPSADSVRWTARISRGGSFNLAIMSASPGGQTRIAKVQTSQGNSVSVQIPKTANSTDFQLSASIPINVNGGDVQFTVQILESLNDVPQGFQLAFVSLLFNNKD